MSDGGSGPGGFGPFNVPPGANDFADEGMNAAPWYRRWYVWVLPVIVLIGALVSIFGPR